MKSGVVEDTEGGRSDTDLLGDLESLRHCEEGWRDSARLDAS